MRILVVSNLYPPAAIGGYEICCEAVVERLQADHEVLVLTSRETRDDRRARQLAAGTASAAAMSQGQDGPHEAVVRRELTWLSPDARGARRAPLASLHDAPVARRALAWKPDLIYVWNGASIPHAVLRILADSGLPLAFRVEEHWFANIFVRDQFLRELLPARRGPARAAWSVGCRRLNALPALRLDPTAPLRAAVSWNSETTRRLATPPPFVEIVLERVRHPGPPHGDVYAAVERDPAPEPLIAYLGRVSPFKGIAVGIEALALLRSEHRVPAELVVIGPEEGEHGSEMRALAGRLGVGPNVRWFGRATPAQAAAELARAHALIVPSTWDEPFGLVMIEGALARVPLVASDVGGFVEAMHDEQHALLFERGDARAAAEALARTLREDEQTAARVQRAHERAQEYRLEAYLDDQERFVLDALAALRGAAGSD
jgi:glycosyltransferase involved in cell wall biosynthesis